MPLSQGVKEPAKQFPRLRPLQQFWATEAIHAGLTRRGTPLPTIPRSYRSCPTQLLARGAHHQDHHGFRIWEGPLGLWDRAAGATFCRSWERPRFFGGTRGAVAAIGA